MKILTELHGAPGFEDDVKSYMESEMEPFVDANSGEIIDIIECE